MPRAIVVGSGISGLTAALRLQQRGIAVTVLERDVQIGGRMVCTRRDGFTINRASGILPGSYHQIRRLIDELGLADHTELISTEFGIPVNGVTHRLRTYGAGMAIDALRTRLISPRSKILLMRLIADAFRARAGISYENPAAGLPYDRESAADYCRRRLNREILERVVDPVMRAMFLVPAEQVSVVDLFFMIVQILGRGQLRYTGGIDFVVRAIAERVPVLTAAEVATVERSDDGAGATVTWRDGDGEHAVTVDGCVLAVSGRDLLAIHPGLDPVQREILARMRWADSIVGHFALRSRPADTALLNAIPATEREELSLVVFHDLVAPDCVPRGKGLVSGYWMHEWSRERMHNTDEQLLGELLEGLERFVPGVSELVEFFYIDRWQPVVMCCPHGIYRDLAGLRARIDPDDPIQLAGDYFGYGSTNRCAITGEQAAERLARSLQATALGRSVVAST
jgi:protoporphyrinogen/coproporphyrinogen III oxidase